MGSQMKFQRYELKYLLTAEQKAAVLEAMAPYMSLDEYGRSTIRNIYFDTANFRLIRRSIERPAYKEKLRLRSYRRAGPDDPVFVELKKKYKSVVYKRRLAAPQQQAARCLCSAVPLPVQSQIADEINYFCRYYRSLYPSVFLSYEREAFFMPGDGSFRVTFDENILSRRYGFSFSEEIYGTPLLAEGISLMEIKTGGGIPLWMVHCLTENGIFKASFSKYGTAYMKTIQNDCQGGILYA